MRFPSIRSLVPSHLSLFSRNSRPGGRLQLLHDIWVLKPIPELERLCFGSSALLRAWDFVHALIDACKSAENHCHSYVGEFPDLRV